ncbi:ribonuclease inhibitor-like isoform X2 [Python bivittatus]|uniref:Ribonuclease inhibitor-like isoform X2 n=1 Tax=Python bivittatus TaxID=176946 RepID=A0A9F5MYW9_PYTBI|nr:ribonuclease inhibitor-like isoform X2 [Python bivittatus]
MTVRFLFGFLSEEKRMTQLKQEFGWKIPPKNKEFLLDCVKTICKKLKSNSPLWNEVFNFFYELQDDSFLKNSLEDVILLNFVCQSVWDFIILAYCIQHCNSLKVLEVDRPDFLYFKSPVKQFKYCDERVVQKYVDLLFKGLISVGNLRKLSISTWSLNESGCRHLAEFLRKNHKLRELCLPWCNISDNGLKLLCEELKHPDCELEVLQLSWETLTVSSSRHLADVLRKKQRLVELHLSFHNCVTHERREEAFQLLCEGLKDPDCKLDTLRIPELMLTLSCYRQLAEVLWENQRLRELDLTQYHQKGEDIKLLSEGLKHSDCKLETLTLSADHLRESPCKYLAEVLKENQSLKKLYLKATVVHDKGMELLFEALKGPCCKLEKLWLSKAFFSTSFCQCLADILRENQVLKELALISLHITDKEMEELCEVLKHPNCKLEKFGIFNTHLRESWCRYLAEVLKENQTLRQLALHQCHGGSQEMELLCEELKHPNCKLEKVWIPAVSLTESCCRHLAQVFKENQNLRELDLFHCDIGDREKELLYEGLKHPACKLEKLLRQLVSIHLHGLQLHRTIFRRFSNSASKKQFPSK